ncbi:threonine--tRNA ligase [bacterium]|nr:threonine--tRNA ligase [bacterium]
MSKKEKVDHKILGRELDLFAFSGLIGSGLPLWTPKGAILSRLLDDFVWELRKKRGYARVDIPYITKKDLFVKSGHWDKFKDELFKMKSRDGHVFALKPMNCPFHTQIYDRRPHSYRELPQRYSNTTQMYRDEQTGELQGLSRVRGITIDDAHVFCRDNQVVEEADKIWDIIEEFYGAFDFPLDIRLSFHDPKEMDKYIGDEEVWKRAEDELRKLVKSRKVKAPEVLGEAAFYGPKIDFVSKDSLGREWQVATIQLDMNLPERFDLTCVNEKGENEQIVMLHAAIMGSIERFLAVLIEHYVGAFPLWLAPVQVAVLPISKKQKAYASSVLSELEDAGVRVEAHDSNETIGKRIREAETQKIPYIFVVGDKEKAVKSVAVRKHGKGDLGVKKLKTFIPTILKEIELKK